jgi:hypothetical protein
MHKRYVTGPSESLAGIALREMGKEEYWQYISEYNADRFPGMGPNDYYPLGTTLLMDESDRFEADLPGDDLWLVVFDDQDIENRRFDCEGEARDYFDSTLESCYLYKLMERK